MKKLIPAVVLAIALLGSGSRAVAAPGDATEKLLKDAKLDYKKVKDGVFRLAIENKQGNSVIVIEERKAAWKDSKGNDVLYVYVYTEVFTTKVGFKPSPEMLTKLNESNDRILFGSLGLAKNKDNTYTLFRNGTMFLKNMDGEQLEDLVYVTHGAKFFYQKEFLTFLED